MIHKKNSGEKFKMELDFTNNNGDVAICYERRDILTQPLTLWDELVIDMHVGNCEGKLRVHLDVYEDEIFLDYVTMTLNFDVDVASVQKIQREHFLSLEESVDTKKFYYSTIAHQIEQLLTDTLSANVSKSVAGVDSEDTPEIYVTFSATKQDPDTLETLAFGNTDLCLVKSLLKTLIVKYGFDISNVYLEILN